MSSPNRTFAFVFGELTPEEFVATYLFQRPLVLQRNDARFSDLLTSATFIKALSSCTNCRAVFKDLLQATIRPVDAEDLYKAGATICALGLERASSGLHELVTDIRSCINYRGVVSLKGYLSPDGGGFAPHHDTSVTTTLQIEGSKTWWFSRRPIEYFPLANTPSPLPKNTLAKLDEVGYDSTTLNPGDVLCLPPGTIHWASATGVSLALNLSFEYVDCGLPSRLADLAQQELLRIPNFRAPTTGNGSLSISPESSATWRKACLHASDYFARLADADRDG
jgi:ribosomal protein L16 Arg81 hydroxylase